MLITQRIKNPVLRRIKDRESQDRKLSKRDRTNARARDMKGR